jgi:PncC family amidohydrolase
MVMDRDIRQRSEHLARALSESGRLLVLAESCTAGLIAASVAAIPGISDHLCGSAVTYRDATKLQWLGVPQTVLESRTAVSPEVARLMVTGVLTTTPEADLAASVTGYLGPDAPSGCDGLVYIAIGERCPETGRITDPLVREIRLATTGRVARQQEAVKVTLDLLTGTVLRPA